MRNIRIKKEGPGRKRQYGKYLLNKPNSLPNPDYVEQQRKGWCYGLDYLYIMDICRRSKDYTMLDIPIIFIRAEVCKENGEKKYDRD